LLLITNVTDNIPIYSFADRNAAATSVSFDADADETTVVLDYDTSGMDASDSLQIFIEEDAVSFEPDDTYTDPVSKFRVSEAQTLIDTDFEYGLQSTKWETLELVNNIPGSYSRTGDTPIEITNIESIIGSKQITVTSANHGLLVGTPFDVRGLNQSNLDGSYIVEFVPGADTFTFTARTTATTIELYGDYTYLIPGRFYAGSQINYTSIETDGAVPTSTVTVTTRYPSGFQPNTEFYLINTLGYENISFDATAIDPVDSDLITSSNFNPNGTGILYTTTTRATDIWDYTSRLNSKFFRAGSGGDVGTAGTFTINSHGFAIGQQVVIIAGPNSTVPTGVTNGGRYYVRTVATNTFRLATTNSDGTRINFTANTGSGVIGVYQGYAITAIAASDVVSFAQSTSGENTSQPLAVFSTAATFGTCSPAATPTTRERMFDGNIPQTYYFENTGTTTRLMRTGPAGSGTRMNFTATTVGANAIVVPYVANTNANSFYLPAHGYVTNDAVVYNNGGGTNIGGLISATTVNIQSITSTATTITVNATGHGLVGGNPVEITGVTPIVYNNTWEVATATTNSFTITSNLNPGAASVVGSLKKAYWVDRIDANRFALKATKTGSGINLINYTATGTSHTFAYTKLRANANKIFLPAHGLPNGAEVIYDSNSETPVGGLVDASTYFVVNSEANYFQLAESPGTSVFIDLTSAGTGSQKFTVAGEGVFDGSYVVNNVIDSTSFTLTTDNYEIPKILRAFDPTVDVNTTDDYITLPSHRLITGSSVVYSNGDGSDIGGLIDANTYYVIRVSRNRIRLADTYSNSLSGIFVDLSTIGSGITHSLESANLAGESDGIGTISLAAGSDVVTGTDTVFTRIYKEGDPFVVNLSDSEVFETTIVAVLGDTSLKISDQSQVTDTGLFYLVRTSLYIKSGAYSVHRPYDGGVEINAGLRSDTQIIRQTRRYFRYQSGKGLNIQFAINFNPPVDIVELSCVDNAGTAVATVKTRYPHGLAVNQTVTIRDAEVSTGDNPYNGEFTIDTVVDTNTFTITLPTLPLDLSANGFPQLVVKNWGGSKLKAGAFDFQNGMLWEYDGNTVYAVRRNSTTQIAGSVKVNYLSNEVLGYDTRFVDQLVLGDKIVIRGQSYKVVNISNNNTLYIQPAFKGVNANYAIVSKTIDIRVPQSQWNIDVCDGTGKHGYVLDVTRIQMAYIDYSWYGAGKIRFGLKDQNGHVKYVHEFKHNNRENKAFMRSGNLPARYEIENVGSPAYAPSLAHWGTTVQMDGKLDDDQAYLFTASSSLLTFDGTTATVTGTGNYIYVRSDGSTSTVPTSFSTRSVSSVGTVQDTLNFSSAHGLSTGQLVQYTTSSGAATPLVNNNFYYVIVRSATAISLATTENAARLGQRINITATGSGTQTVRFNFTFGTGTKTDVPGYGNRIIHRFTTDATGFAAIGQISFGTKITSTAIAARSLGNAYVYRILAGSGGAAIVDFFFETDATDALSTGNTSHFIAASTSAGIAHTVGTDSPVPATIPLISVRLAPSVDSGIVGNTGHRDIINRMQLTLDSVGLLTTHDMEVKLLLNGQLNNVNWSNSGVPSLTQILAHQAYDTIANGTTVFTFRAAGNPPDSSGKRTASAFAADISKLLSLGNCILGGDGVYPDGPDILTIAVSPLNTTGVTVNSPISISARVSWSESQA
jgi:hypothetical protein